MNFQQIDASTQIQDGTITRPLMDPTSVFLSLHADSNPNLTGDVQLISGTNVTIVQSGQTITINSNAGSGGGPSGPSGSLQYNSSGVFAGDANVIYNGSQIIFDLVDSFGGLKVKGRSGGEASISLQPDTVSDGTSGQWILYTHGSQLSNSADFAIFNGASGAPALNIQAATGNVGIGQINPQYLLDVNGRIHSVGNILTDASVFSSAVSGLTGDLSLLPFTDSTTGVKFTKANHTVIAAIDTTNSRLDMHNNPVVNVGGISMVAGTQLLLGNTSYLKGGSAFGPGVQLAGNGTSTSIVGAPAGMELDSHQATDGSGTYFPGISIGTNGNSIQFSTTGPRSFDIQMNSQADPSALLALYSNIQGFLPPRLSTAQRNVIPSPAAGLQIFNTTTMQPEVFNGTIWTAMGGGGGGTPGGSNGDLQYNSSGTFGGATGITTNGTNLTLSTGTLFLNQSGVVFDDSGSNSVRVSAPTSITASYAIKWPATQGSASTFLQNDGAGNLTWAAGGSGSPGGATTNVQYNLSGAFAGDSNFVWDHLNKILTLGVHGTQTGNLTTGGNITSYGTNPVFGDITDTTDDFEMDLEANGQDAAFILNHTTGNLTIQTSGTQILVVNPIALDNGNITTDGSGNITVNDIFANVLFTTAGGRLECQNQGSVVFDDTAGSSGVSIAAPSVVTSGYNLFLPTAQGAVNSTIQNNGTGQLSFVTFLSGPEHQASVNYGVRQLADESGTSAMSWSLSAGRFLVDGNNLNALEFDAATRWLYDDNSTTPVGALSWDTTNGRKLYDTAGTSVLDWGTPGTSTFSSSVIAHGIAVGFASIPSSIQQMVAVGFSNTVMGIDPVGNYPIIGSSIFVDTTNQGTVSNGQAILSLAGDSSNGTLIQMYAGWPSGPVPSSFLITQTGITPDGDGTALAVQIRDAANPLSQWNFGWNGVFQFPNLATDPTTAAAGGMWFNSTAKKFKFWDGTAVQTITSA